MEDCAASLLGDGVKTVDRWAEQQGMSVPVAIEVLVTMGLAADGYRTPAESAAGPEGTWSPPRRGAWDQDRHGWPLHAVHSITGQRRDAGFEACEDHA